MIYIPLFKKHAGHLQGSIFGTVDTLIGESQKKAFPGSPEHWFYEFLMRQIRFDRLTRAVIGPLIPWRRSN